MYTDAAKNAMLDAIGITHLSLHNAWSASGANELAGGTPAYARKPVTLAAAAAGSKAASTQPNFDVPANETVRWVGYWTALTAGTFLGMVPNGGTEKKRFITDVLNNKILCDAHGFANNQKLVFFGGTVPGGLTAGVIVYAKTVSTDDFEVSATPGGATIDLTSKNSGDCNVAAIVEETFGAQGNHQVTSASWALNG